MGACVMLLVASIVLAVAGLQTWRVSAFIDRAQAAQGTVTALQPVSSSNGSATYAPVFTFFTRDGEPVTVTSRSSSNPPGFDLGESVMVLYDPSHPQDARINSLWQLWGIPLFLTGFALILILVAGIFAMTLRSLRRQVPAAPSSQ